MKLAQIYQCFCEPTRLRILHLLTQTPLCVCHFQDALREPQVKISKHLAYFRAVVWSRRNGLGTGSSILCRRKPSSELETNLKCLQDCARTDPVFRKDLSVWRN